MKYEVALHWPRLACERRTDVFLESSVGFCSVCMYSCISDLVIFIRKVHYSSELQKATAVYMCTILLASFPYFVIKLYV